LCGTRTTSRRSTGRSNRSRTRASVVYLIIIAYPSKNPAIDAVVLHPGIGKDYKFTVGAVNTTNASFPPSWHAGGALERSAS
jgi:hypothetical protein